MGKASSSSPKPELWCEPVVKSFSVVAAPMNAYVAGATWANAASVL